MLGQWESDASLDHLMQAPTRLCDAAIAKTRLDKEAGNFVWDQEES